MATGDLLVWLYAYLSLGYISDPFHFRAVLPSQTYINAAGRSGLGSATVVV